MTQLQFENSFCLSIGDLELLDQRRLWLVFLANDLDNFIDIKKCNQQAIQDMHAIDDLVEAKLQTSSYSFGTELQPLLEQTGNIFYLWPLIDANHIEIGAVVFLKICG